MDRKKAKEEYRTRVRDAILTAIANSPQVDSNGKVPVEEVVTIATGVLTEALAELSYKVNLVAGIIMTSDIKVSQNALERLVDAIREESDSC